ncbi:MAG: hypothetical protein JNM83_00650 [Myxococcales bacterium]|nr:hypothetical protein [Myxococcales bacterium]
MVSLRRSSPFDFGRSLFPRIQSVPHSLLAMLALLLAFAWFPSKASAQDKKSVMVLAIEGAPPKLQKAIENALKKDYNVIPEAKWAAASKKLNVTGHGTEEVALVANELKVDVVITGKVKTDKDSGNWKLNIAARHGPTGKPVGKLSYDLKSEKVDPATITTVEGEIGPAVVQAIAGPPVEKPVVAQAEPPPADPTAKLGVEEDPIAKLARAEAEKRRREQELLRPIYYPFIDATAGAIISGRNFSYTEDADPASPNRCYDLDQRVPDPKDPGGRGYVSRYLPYKRGSAAACPGFATSVAAGVRVDVTAYPLAFMKLGAIKGLGLGATFDYMFWPDSKYGSGASQVLLSTREWRVEGGIRYHYNILNKRNMPSVLFNAQYGAHFFAVAKEEKQFDYLDENFNPKKANGINDHGLPDILYQYVTLGLGARVPYFVTEKLYFAGLVNVNVHVPISFGEITNRFDSANTDTSTGPVPDIYGNGGFGPASGWGLRASLTVLEAMLWKGLTVRLSGYYETFRYTFDLGKTLSSQTPGDVATGRDARHLASGASDNYFGGIIQVGYQY